MGCLSPPIPLSPYENKALISDGSDWRKKKKKEAETQTDCHRRQPDDVQVKGAKTLELMETVCKMSAVWPTC